MALTATATPRVQDQLERIVLRNPRKEIGSVNRPNISLHAHEMKHLPRNGMYLHTAFEIAAQFYVRRRFV